MASSEFLDGFCAVLRGFAARQKIKYGQRGLEDDWVDANLVYQEYIRDRHHTHLTATRWKSVAGFLRFLGQKGIAEVKQKRPSQSAADDAEYLYILPETEAESGDQDADESSTDFNDGFDEQPTSTASYTATATVDPSKRPKWFIKLIDKSPEAILAAKNKTMQQRKVEQEQGFQARQLEAVQRQAQSMSNSSSGKGSSNNAPIVLIQKKPQHHVDAAAAKKDSLVASLFCQDDDDDVESIEPDTASSSASAATDKKKHLAVLDELQNEDIQAQRAFIPYETGPIVIEVDQAAAAAATELQEISWIRKGLLIRIRNDTVGHGKYFGLLAVIDAVVEDFGAQVSVLSSGDQLLLDQDDCGPVSEVSDDEFDSQLRHLDAAIMSTALQTDRCIILAENHVGREGRVLGKRQGTGKFQVEVTEAGSSHIHRLTLDLRPEEFCIFFE